MPQPPYKLEELDAKYIRLVIDLVTIRSMAAWNNPSGEVRR